MGQTDLATFIEEKQKDNETEAINWENRKNEWTSKLDDLYKDIESWLKPLEQVSITYANKQINEEYIGLYNVDKMEITIAGEQVTLDPIGTLIIGSSGRVDMKGKNGEFKLILIPSSITNVEIRLQRNCSEDSKEQEKDEEKVWKIVSSSLSVQFIELDSDSFSDALLALIK